jgi:hypothetical protein
LQVHERVILEEFPSPYCRTITVPAAGKAAPQPSIVAAVVHSRYIGLDVHCHLSGKDITAVTQTGMPAAAHTNTSNAPTFPAISQPTSRGYQPQQPDRASPLPQFPSLLSKVAQRTGATAPTLLACTADLAKRPCTHADRDEGTASALPGRDVAPMAPLKKQRTEIHKPNVAPSFQREPQQNISRPYRPPLPQTGVLAPSIAMLTSPARQGFEMPSHSSSAPPGCTSVLPSNRGQGPNTGMNFAPSMANAVSNSGSSRSDVCAMGPCNPGMARGADPGSVPQPMQLSKAAEFWKFLQERRAMCASLHYKDLPVPHMKGPVHMQLQVGHPH